MFQISGLVNANLKTKKKNACLFFSVSRKTFLVENRVDF